MDGTSKRYFDSIGADWDRLRQEFFSDRVRDAALSRGGVEAGCVAADLGAGTGFLTQGLLERRARVIAVDQSAVMLEALRRKWPPPAPVDCRVGTAERLPLADAEVNACLANMYLHHVEKPARAIREMARILEPGGRAVVTDLDAHDHAFLRDEHHDRWMGFARDDVARWFGDAGFSDVTVEGLGEECCARSRTGERAAVGIFVAHATRPE